MLNIETQIVKFNATDNLELNGFLLGSINARNLFIFIHGLGSNCFKRDDIYESLVNEGNSVLAFNNRGSGIINRFDKVNKDGTKVGQVIAGFAHEVFTDCVFDIEGAVSYAQSLGFKNIYLIGHSTGCQKSIYYLSKKSQSPIKGVVLLAPLSDFAGVKYCMDQKEYKETLKLANKMNKLEKGQELLPINASSYTISAQRWLSLNTSESEEEIFAYASGKIPKILLKNRKPILIILAGQDEYAHRPIDEISAWFKRALKDRDSEIEVIRDATHSFDEYSVEIKGLIERFIGWKI